MGLRLPGSRTSTVRFRRLSVAPAAFGVLFRSRAGPPIAAGNGKTMTKKAGKASHTQAKEKRTNGKPGGRTAGIASSGTEGTTEQEETTTKVATQKPQRAIANRRSRTREAVDARQPAKPAKRGLARLKEEARNMVEKDVKEILRGLKTKARKGSASEIKLLVHLAGLNEQKPEAKPDNEGCMAILQDLASQPEYQEPEENSVDSRSGRVQSAQSPAEDPSIL
jgi:hypothetical protein